jgi:hypothetical protein
MVNTQEAVYSTSGTLITSQPLYSLFGASSSTVLTAPHVLYDNLSGRWFASAENLTGNSIDVAVSAGSDPTRGWTIYSFVANVSQRPDGPFLGVSSFMVGLSANDTNTGTGKFSGSQLWVANKTQMEAGTTVNFYSWGPFINGNTSRHFYRDIRAVQETTPNATQIFALIDPTPDEVVINITGAPPANPVMTVGYQAIGVFNSPPPAAQAGTSQLLNTTEGGIGSAVFANGLLTNVETVGCGGVTCVRVDQMWAANFSLWEDFNVSLGGAWLFDPAVTTDARGDLTLIVGVSNGTTYPSLLLIGQAYNEENLITFESTLISGTASSLFGCAGNLCPYGAYFGAAADPISSYNVWLAGEYITGGAPWSTYISGASSGPISAGTLTASPPVIDFSQSTTFTVPASGGSGGYSFSWSGLPLGCVSRNLSALPCTPSGAGTYSVVANVTDSQGATSTSSPLAFTVNPKVGAGIPTPNHPGGDVGQSVLISAHPSGGSGSYAFTWLGLPASGCANATTATVTCALGNVASYRVSVRVSDSLHQNATIPDLSFVVSPALSVATPLASPNPVSLGSAMTLTAAATGGAGAYSFVWKGLPGGCGTSNSTTLSCTPSASGTFSVTVSVTDQNGMTVVSSPVSVVVNGGPGGIFQPLSSGSWIYYAIVIGVIAAAVFGSVLLLGRRRKVPPLAPAPPGGAETPRSDSPPQSGER